MDTRVHPSGVPSVDVVYKPDPGGQSGTLTPTDFVQKAKSAVAEYYNRVLMGGGFTHPVVVEEDVFVVWFVKVLQNWKAMVSTVYEDDRYFEVTYNGDKREAYVDEYVKKGNLLLIPEHNVAELRD